MIGVHMGDDQGTDAIQREVDYLMIGSGAMSGCVCSLEKAAVDENAAVSRHVQLVAGAGYAVMRTVVGDIRVVHQLIL